jgi:hypothetical protein
MSRSNPMNPVDYEFEQALKQLAPKGMDQQYDHLIFRAGQASVKRTQTWKLCSTLFAGLWIGTLAFLWPSTPKTLELLPKPESTAQWASHTPKHWKNLDPTSYINASRLVFEKGLDALPKSPRRSTRSNTHDTETMIKDLLAP